MTPHEEGSSEGFALGYAAELLVVERRASEWTTTGKIRHLRQQRPRAAAAAPVAPP